MAVWPLLLIVAILVSLVVLSNQEISGLSQLKSKERLRADSQSLKTHIGILFRNRTGCLANLASADSFNAGLSAGAGALTANAAHDIKLYNPNGTASGGAGSVFLEAGSAYDALTVEQIRFSGSRSVSASGHGFLAELGVALKQNDVRSAVKIPFYIVTNASNAMVDCFATQFTKRDPVTNVDLTLEDEVCIGINGGGWHFDPATYKCVN